ncbi:phosphotriesterase-related protein isoform X2 [Scyliorhinus canicula]|uniref:phosphotriesterase-related protein isoform X2 n=1 Tax=Scyliorhinus canicula TaxID=7830 RepID=UPI0018F56073|nr:phosphotriesterase-related protein isoform X2 [Scyliorhinus canicula]
MQELSGKVQTVRGLIDPGQMGRTLTHEHLTMSFAFCYSPPPRGQEACSEMPMVMKNLYWLKQHPYSHRGNLLLNEEIKAVKEELVHFKEVGGGTMVENTTTGIFRDVKTLQRLSQETGVHIISGAGFYVGETHSCVTRNTTVEKLTDILVNEVLHGADGTDIKCGVIGEIGCSWPMMESERKVLQATAAAQIQLGCPVIIHPGRNSDSPFHIVRILQEAGADISKTVMSHLDRIRLLLEEGYGDNVLMAHDIHTKNRLTKYGGHGYSHILTNIVPEMKKRGLSQPAIDKILVDNPKRWLTFK